jgi:hypothetical protein
MPSNYAESELVALEGAHERREQLDHVLTHPAAVPCLIEHDARHARDPANITTSQAQVANATGPNQSLLAGWIEPTSHENPSPSYIR